MKKDEAFEFLRKSGLRVTALKSELVELFLGGGCGLSVKDLMLRLNTKPDVSTVYRALNSLTEKGFLRHSLSPDGVVQYRCTSTFYPDHGHFCCVKCGERIPVKRKLPADFLLLLELEYGVEVESVDFLIEGKCMKCRD